MKKKKKKDTYSENKRYLENIQQIFFILITHRNLKFAYDKQPAVVPMYIDFALTQVAEYFIC